jgi:phosphatidate cytidylyltransferase
VIRDNLIDPFSPGRGAFDSPVVRWICVTLVVILSIAPILISFLTRRHIVADEHRAKMMRTYASWLVLAPMMAAPVLLGRGYKMLAVGALSILCYREFARATGLFRERIVSATIVVGLLLITLVTLDNWYIAMAALWPLTIAMIMVLAILSDRPKGYLQRVGLGALGFMICGVFLGHLGFIANDLNFRPILFWLVACVEVSDVLAYVCGKSFGRLKLAPNTSPNKTLGGAIGAAVVTTILAAVLARFVFHDTPLDTWPHAIALGLLISILGQFGDLLMSSIKRDIGIKDFAATFPGHGGFLDRFDSLLLVTPAVFYYIGYFIGVGANRPAQIFF